MTTIEDRVRARMADERREATRDRRGLDKRAKVAADRLTRAQARYDRVLARVEASMAAGRAVTSAAEEEVAAALANLTRATTEKIRAGNDVTANELRARTLDSTDEFERRVKLAKVLAREAHRVVDDDPTGRDAVAVVLLHAGKPLHYREITRLALESGLIKTKGKTPKQTISAYLTRAVREGDRFVRVEPGVFGLAGRDEAVTT